MQQAEAARGFLRPDWSLDLTLGQMGKLREQCRRAKAASSSSLVSRTADKGHRRRLGSARRRRSSTSKSIPRSIARSR